MSRGARDDLSRLENDVRETRRRMREARAALRPLLGSALRRALPGPLRRRTERPRPAALAYGGNRPATRLADKAGRSWMPLSLGAVMGLAVLIPRMLRRQSPRDR